MVIYHIVALIDEPVLNELNLTKKRVRAEDMGVLMGGALAGPNQDHALQKRIVFDLGKNRKSGLGVTGPPMYYDSDGNYFKFGMAKVLLLLF